jgi:hypothetical protein
MFSGGSFKCRNTVLESVSKYLFGTVTLRDSCVFQKMFFPKNGCMDQEGFLGPISRHAQLKGHEAAVYALSASGHARCILSGGGEGWIAEWNLDAPDKGRLLARMDAQVFALLRLSSGE